MYVIITRHYLIAIYIYIYIYLVQEDEGSICSPYIHILFLMDGQDQVLIFFWDFFSDKFILARFVFISNYECTNLT